MTEKEKRIFKLAAEGATNAEIATAVRMTIRTVRALRHKILVELYCGPEPPKAPLQ